MADLSRTVMVERACEHPDLHISQRVETQGNGFILHVDQVKCKQCGEIMVSPTGKGKYLSQTKLVLIPKSLARDRPDVAPPPEQKGPGTEMMALTAELGVDSKPGCSCKSTAAMMDRLGVEGCRHRMTELVLMVESNWESWGWKDKMQAVAQAAWKAAGLGVKATDPIRSLLELAVERAEQKEQTNGD